MRVLITGATGVLGSQVARLCVQRGHAVGALMRPQSRPWRIEDILPQVHRIEGDLADVPAAAPAIAAFAPEAALHLGWFGVGNRHRDDPGQVHNLTGTMALMDALPAGGAFVGLGSQAEYGVCDAVVREDRPLNPLTLYGHTKAATYLMGRKLCAMRERRFVWLRLFSLYGPYDEPAWLIPHIILTLLRGRKPVLTAGEQYWDYLYTADAAEAIYRCATTAQARGAYNLGSGQPAQVKWIARTIRDCIDPSLPLGLGERAYDAHQVMHMEADITALRQATGWSPQVSLRDGLARTVEWFRKERGRYEQP